MIKVKVKLYKDVIMIVYNSPSALDADFFSYLEDKIKQLVIKEDCIVIGDFNIHLLLNSFFAKSY